MKEWRQLGSRHSRVAGLSNQYAPRDCFGQSNCSNLRRRLRSCTCATFVRVPRISAAAIMSQASKETASVGEQPLLYVGAEAPGDHDAVADSPVVDKGSTCSLGALAAAQFQAGSIKVRTALNCGC